MARCSGTAVATRVPMTAEGPSVALARYWMLAQPRSLPLVHLGDSRAQVLPVMVTAGRPASP